ncbi:MAG: hypothetical protein IPK28_12610 [Devosia sp.]|nr:hypothetical protein [Devosia sp.]
MSEDKKVGLFTLEWFRPLWRRVIVIAVIALWCGWEWLFNHDQFWGLATAAMLAYGVWTFFINFETELNKANNGKPKD